MYNPEKKALASSGQLHGIYRRGFRVLLAKEERPGTQPVSVQVALGNVFHSLPPPLTPHFPPDGLIHSKLFSKG